MICLFYLCLGFQVTCAIIFLLKPAPPNFSISIVLVVAFQFASFHFTQSNHENVDKRDFMFMFNNEFFFFSLLTTTFVIKLRINLRIQLFRFVHPSCDCLVYCIFRWIAFCHLFRIKEWKRKTSANWILKAKRKNQYKRVFCFEIRTGPEERMECITRLQEYLKRIWFCAIKNLQAAKVNFNVVRPVALWEIEMLNWRRQLYKMTLSVQFCFFLFVISFQIQQINWIT